MIRRSYFLLLLVSATFPCVDAATPQASAQQQSFKHDIRPILSNHCFACHGPDRNHREADVRLDIADEVDLDEVLDRIRSTDPELVMPPPKVNKPLAPKQVAALARWIDDGALYEQHWAFVSPADPTAPTVKQSDWSDQAIDGFVLANLESHQLHPSPRADKRTLIRRVTLDLTGLPPTLTEIEEFLADTSPDAYEKLVDRLIRRPAYGEQMARYWLDLVRFADTNGLHHDHYREMTPYRDWVIRSFNDNLPMDQFITYQLAGDLYDDPSIEQQIASGFNRLHLIIDRGTALPEESFFRNVVDQVSAVGTAFMGLTLQCAVCHDHKFDPITQKDFYQLAGFFNNFDGKPETGFRDTVDFARGLQPPYLELPSLSQQELLGSLNAELVLLKSEIQATQSQLPVSKGDTVKSNGSAKADPKTEKPKADTAEPDSIEHFIRDVQVKFADQQKAAVEHAIKTLTEKLDKRVQARDQLLREIPATLVMKERSEVRPSHVMVRGAYDQPGEEVQRGTPSFLPPMKTDSPLKSRMDLANWLTDSSHPLTARVTVNRFWQQFFGVGLVRTSEDFGSQGETPSHPELLDHLAARFVKSGWNVKESIRTIVLSQTYQQSSRATRDQYIEDPDNRMLARGSRFRLDAEVVRDQMLSVCGLMNTQMYGKSVKPPQPDGLWKIVAMPTSYPNEFTADSGSHIYRRSVYTFWKRGLPPPQMTIFDAPTRESCIARRERTNTPLQALLLMNEEQHFAAATHFAKILIDETDWSDADRVKVAYESMTAQESSAGTVQELMAGLQEFRQHYHDDPEAAARMIRASTSPGLDSVSTTEQQVQLASWTMLVHSLLNLDITKTHE